MSQLYRCDWPECATTTEDYKGWEYFNSLPDYGWRGAVCFWVPFIGWLIATNNRWFCPDHADLAAQVFGEKP